MLMQPEVQNSHQPPPTGWQFVPNQQSTVTTNSPPEQSDGSQSEAHISWSASEFIAYQKNPGWYVVATISLLTITGVIYLVTKDGISSGVTFLLGILFIALASRQPRVLSYEISNQGVKINGRLFAFSSMRSFTVVEQDSLRSIDIIPLKRFMPIISMYYDPKDEGIITSTIGRYLPKEDRPQPLIDKLMHKIRF